MTLKFKIEESNEETGVCKYYQKEYTIEYIIDTKGSEANKKTAFLLIYETLSIVFNEDNKFISFDAFTNKDQWKFNPFITINKIEKTGTLYLEEKFEGDDRYSFNSYPEYEYSNDGKLKIHLLKEISPKFYQISNNLLVGIENQIITSLVALDVNLV